MEIIDLWFKGHLQHMPNSAWSKISVKIYIEHLWVWLKVRLHHCVAGNRLLLKIPMTDTWQNAQPQLCKLCLVFHKATQSIFIIRCCNGLLSICFKDISPYLLHNTAHQNTHTHLDLTYLGNFKIGLFLTWNTKKNHLKIAKFIEIFPTKLPINQFKTVWRQTLIYLMEMFMLNFQLLPMPGTKFPRN